jgi:hypothetical protein
MKQNFVVSKKKNERRRDRVESVVLIDEILVLIDEILETVLLARIEDRS